MGRKKRLFWETEVADEVIRRIDIFPGKDSELARLSNNTPSDFSKIKRRTMPLRPGDQRVIRIGQILGLKPDECFRKQEG